MTPRSLAALAVSLLFVLPAVAADDAAIRTDDPELRARLERMAEAIDAARVEAHVPGASLAVVVNDEIVYAGGFGMRDVEGAKPATAETIYAVGSTTKAFTAALIATLIEDGAMTWDDLVTTHVAEFTVSDPEANANATVRDLLCHRIGLMGTDLLWFTGDTTWPDMQPAIARAEFRAPFREKWQYQNVMYLVAGECAARAGDGTWADLTRTRLLEPLGMSATTLSIHESANDPNLAVGYAWREEERGAFGQLVAEARAEPTPMRNLDGIAPAGAINSSVLDMARWVRMQLARGVIDGERLLPEARLEEMWTAQISTGPSTSYGLGWGIGERQGHRLLQHTGGIDGFRALVAMLPDDDVGFVLLTNLAGGDLITRAQPIVFDALLEEPVDPATLEAAEAFETFLGRYDFEVLDVVVTAQMRNGRLALDVPGQTVYELDPPNDEGLRAFRGFPDLFAEFPVEGDGPAPWLKIHQAGIVYELPREGVAVTPDFDEAALRPYLGRYTLDDRSISAVIHRGRLAIDVPGQMTFDLHPPDDEGLWHFRAADGIAVAFERDEQDRVIAVVTHQFGNEERWERDGGADERPTLPEVEDVMHLVQRDQGMDAFETLLNLELTGTVIFRHQGIEGTARLRLAGYDRLRADVDIAPFGWIRVAALGRLAWEESAFLPKRSLDATGLQRVLASHPCRLVCNWSELFTDIEVTDVVRADDGRLDIHVKATTEDAPPVRFVVDESRGLVTQLTVRLAKTGNAEMTVRFEDFRDVEGVLIPFRMISDDPTSGTVVVQYDEARTNQTFAEMPWILDPADEP